MGERGELTPYKPEIYLAGKVEGIKWKVVEYLKDEAWFHASDGANHSEHLWGGGYWDLESRELADLVESECLEVIANSNALLAVVATPDSFGTIAEIAYAASHSKHILLLIIDDEYNPASEWTQKGHQLFDAYWFVASFPCVRTQVVRTLDEARDAAAQFIYELRPKLPRKQIR